MKNKHLIQDFRATLLKHVESAVNVVLDSSDGSTAVRVDLLERLSAINGLLRAREIDVSEIGRQTQELAFAATQFAGFLDDDPVFVRMRIMDLECEAFLRRMHDDSPSTRVASLAVGETREEALAFAV